MSQGTFVLFVIFSNFLGIQSTLLNWDPILRNTVVFYNENRLDFNTKITRVTWPNSFGKKQNFSIEMRCFSL